MTQPLDTLWYTRCPVPTGLGIAVQKGWLQDTVGALGTPVSYTHLTLPTIYSV